MTAVFSVVENETDRFRFRLFSVVEVVGKARQTRLSWHRHSFSPLTTTSATTRGQRGSQALA